MGMLADRAKGLTPAQQHRAQLARSEVNQDPAPIPMWDEQNPDPGAAPAPAPVATPEPAPEPVQKEEPYINNVQGPGMFDEFVEGAELQEEEGPSGPGMFDEFEVEEPAPEPEAAPPEPDEPGAGDYGRVLMGGLAQTGGMVAGAAEYLSNMVGADSTKEFFGGIRKAATDATDYWHSGLSEAGKRDLEKQYATTSGEAAWKDLDSVMFTIIASAPSTVITMGPAGMAAKAAFRAKMAGGATKASATVAAAKAAAIAGAASEGTLGAGGIASDITTTLEDMSDEEFRQLEGYNKLKGAYPGMNEEDLKLGVISNATRWNAAIGGLITGAVGAAAGPIEAKIFTGDMGFGKRLATGALSEGIQEGLQSPAEQAMTNLGNEEEVTEGLLEATLAGIVGGAGAGGPMAAFGGGGKNTQETDTLADEADTLLNEESDTPEGDAAQEEVLQAVEAEERVQDIESMQDAARAESAAGGGDLLDQETAASAVSDPLIEEDDKIKAHLKRMQQRVDAETVVAAEQDKIAAEREKEVLAGEKETKAAVEKSVKSQEEDKAYAEKDAPKLRIGQKPNKNMGHITEKYEGPLSDKQAVAVEKAAGPTTGNAMAEAFKKAADVAATSPTNDQPEPTPAQIEAGNYRKGHANVNGLAITIENPAGSTRKAADGSWEQKMDDHYGYIKRTESAEGPTEQLDVFVGDDHESTKVFVVDQINKDGTFDEHKAMVGYPNILAARRAYAQNYPKGFKVGPIGTMEMSEFKGWLKDGDQTVPYQPSKIKGAPAAATAGPAKEVIQSTTREGGRGARPEAIADDAEAALTDTRNSRKKLRYRKEDDVNATIATVAPDDVMEELDYLVEGYDSEDAGNYKLALEDAIDQAEDQKNTKMLTKLRNVGIELGMYRVIEQEEIDRTSTSRGKVWDFVRGGKKYVYNSEGYQTEMQKAANETIAEEDSTPEEDGTLYHATPEDFEDFEITGKNIGVHLGTKQAANDLAESSTESPGSPEGDLNWNIRQVLSGIKNPFKAKDTGFYESRVFLDFLDPEMKAKSLEKWPHWQRAGFMNGITMGNIREWLQDLGYDGIVYENEAEDAGSLSYISFDPKKQIKNAVGNRVSRKGIRYRNEDTVDAKTLVGDIKKDGDGFTVDNATGEKKTSGFAAGIGKEQVFSGRVATPEEVDAYREKHATELAAKDHYLGAWMYEGDMFLDVSKVYPNTDMGRQRAYKKGKSIGEFGVQDLSKSAEEGYIPIEYADGEQDAIRASLVKGETVQATHYSKTPDLTTLEGSRYGTGIRGQEASRLSDPAAADVRNRVYFYGPTGEQESGLGPNKSTWEQTGLYDLDGDPDGIRAKVTAWAKDTGNSRDAETKANQLDRFIKEAGYSGVISHKQNDIGYVFGDVTLPETSGFAEWFGDSKVVDANGVPIEVYHGTDSDFDTFMAQAPETYVEGHKDMKGIYFSGDGNKASSYARPNKRRAKGNSRPRVIKAFLKIENPLNITKLIAAGQKAGLSFGNAKKEALTNLTPEHDGVIFDGDNFNDAEYVVFESTQVKASDNTTWDAKSGNFRKRLGETNELEKINRLWAKEKLKPITDKLKLLKPVILGNPSEAPKAIYDQMIKDGALKAKGVFDDVTGKLYIFSENHISESDLVSTLMHEGVGHKGVQFLLGDSFESVMADIYANGDKAAIRHAAQKYGLDLNNAEDRQEATEEYIAILAESDVQSTVFQKVVAAVRQALRGLGIVTEWSEADIKRLLRRSKKAMKGKSPKKVMITKEFLVEETGEIVEVETSADVELRNIEKRKQACEQLRTCAR
jgi:hypothetical protein